VVRGILVDDLAPGTRIRVPFGLDEVEGEVDHVYGPPARRHVLVWLTPEVSGEVVAEPITISVPVEAVSEVSPAA
jgi:hypothetical protein